MSLSSVTRLNSTLSRWISDRAESSTFQLTLGLLYQAIHFVTNAKSLSHFCNLIATLSDLFNRFNFELIGITFFTHNSPHVYLLLYSYEMSIKVGPNHFDLFALAGHLQNNLVIWIENYSELKD
jgi:hypothetical protein